jgi:glutamyl-tRNA synthetase
MSNTTHISMRPRVRFAPSPTGNLHIGGLRTALFNWLFARHHQGKFFLRIEDTDVERSQEMYTRSILETLSWTGIDYDEPVVIQSERVLQHRAIAEQLLASGHAYRCYCSHEELERRLGENAKTGEGYVFYDRLCRNHCIERKVPDQPYVVRFKMPLEGTFLFDDLVRGRVEFDLTQFDDFILVRSDGSPMYNFVVVVDDAEMRISHVIRGEEHIANTPKQILLAQACNFAIPHFAHVPIILAQSGKKLSKRDASTAVSDYRKRGFLPEALCNYLVRLGWSHGDQEIFTTEELIGYFSIENVGKKSSIFDTKKLEWVNSVYIKNAEPEYLLYLMVHDVNSSLREQLHRWSDEQILSLVRLYKERVSTLSGLNDELISLYEGPSYTDTLPQDTREILMAFVAALDAIDIVSRSSVETIVRDVCEQLRVVLPKLAQPLRIVLTGKQQAPGVFDLITILGKEETMRRVKKAIATL